MQKHLNYTIKCLSVLVILAFVSGTPLFAAQERNIKTLHTTAAVSLKGISEPEGLKKAVSESLRIAVESVIVELLPQENIIQNFSKIHALIKNKYTSFVIGYKVLADTKDAKSIRVFVESTVSVSDIKNQLSKQNVSLGIQNMPSVLLFVSEKSTMDPGFKFWWSGEPTYYESDAERLITGIFKSKGFPVVSHNHQLAKDAETGEPIGFMSQFDMVAAIKTAKQYKAKAILFVRIEAEVTTNTMGDEKTVSGITSIKVYRTDTGEDIAFAKEQATLLTTNEFTAGIDVMNKSASIAGEKLASYIVGTWKEKEAEDAIIIASIRGKNYLPHLIKLRNALKKIEGVEDVLTRRMQPDSAELEIEYNRDSKTLAGLIMLDTYEGFGINITHAENNELIIELVTNNN